jgi:hypothetical protein
VKNAALCPWQNENRTTTEGQIQSGSTHVFHFPRVRDQHNPLCRIFEGPSAWRRGFSDHHRSSSSSSHSPSFVSLSETPAGLL